MNDARTPIYAFADCICGASFQMHPPLDWEALASWERVAHSQAGHVVDNVDPLRLVASWRGQRMVRVSAEDTPEPSGGTQK